MTLLLDNRLAPITSTIIFFEAEVGNTVTAFLEWQIPIQNKRGVSFDQSHLQGNLEGMFKSLLPLTSVERRRFLFFPTRSAWTAFFDNGHQGTDASTYICKPLNCRALRITAVPHTKRDGKGRYGAVIFSLYGPESNGPTNLVRSVYAANDGGEWVFNATGTKQSFEQEDKYSSPQIRDRFTLEMLEHYLRVLGVQAFEEQFYLCEKGGEFLEKEGPSAPRLQEFSLEEAQAKF